MPDDGQGERLGDERLDRIINVGLLDSSGTETSLELVPSDRDEGEDL
jgi:hypothetical protein